MSAANPAVAAPFRRTATLRLAYGLTTFFGFALSLIGPVMPFLAARLNLSFTEMGYHFMALSVGSLLISVLGERLARRLGRRRTLLLGALITMLALPTMLYGPALSFTLLASLGYGFGIGMMAQISSGMVALEAGEHAAKAYTESNILSGLALFSGPLLVGLIAGSPLGWQMAAFLPVIFFALLLGLFRGLPIPAAPIPGETSTVSGQQGAVRLPYLYWVFGAMVFLAVAIEWLISSWGASFLTAEVGFEASTAALLMSVFPLAMVLGRLSGRRLLNIWPAGRVLLLSLLWVLLTFPIYWLSDQPVMNVLGLFLLGLGAGSLAPLSVSGAMMAGAAAMDRASARLVMFPSTANIIMLQLVGVLSDRYGLRQAYTVEVLLVLVAIGVAIYAHRARAARSRIYAPGVS